MTEPWMRAMGKRTLPLLKVGLFLLSLTPAIRLLAGFLRDDLGANPIEKVIHSTGFWTLTFLILTLSATPLRRFMGWSWPLRCRRMMGLYAFFYATLHLASYLVLDQFFDWPAMIEDLFKRPYITIGFTAFLLLIPLAVTSNQTMMKKMGGRRWRTLHRLVYLITAAGVIHFGWLVKKDLSEPLLFATLLMTLLLLRLNLKRTKRDSLRLGG